MKLLIMSYSYTGNNEIFAKSIAEKLNMEHICITENKKRTIGTIIADFVLHRTPQTEPSPQVMSDYDLIIFVAPVWMGQSAFPLRPYFNELKKHPQKYAYISLSGYANPELPSKLKHITGYEATKVIELHIADLLPPEPKPTPQTISKYRLNEQEVNTLAKQTVSKLKEERII